MRISDWSSDVCSSDLGHDLVECADRPPGHGRIHHASSATTGMFLNVARSSSRAGRIWPRSSTNTTLSSPDSLLTNVRNRLSVSGSQLAVFHSSWSPLFTRALSLTSSAPTPRLYAYPT